MQVGQITCETKALYYKDTLDTKLCSVKHYTHFLIYSPKEQKFSHEVIFEKLLTVYSMTTFQPEVIQLKLCFRKYMTSNGSIAGTVGSVLFSKSYRIQKSNE